MPFAEPYRRQVALLLRTLTHVAAEDCFALKGGTAINLFIRDMPRLSVDIDLTYLPIESRKQSLTAIDAAMKRIAGRLRRVLHGAKISESQAEGAITKLFIREVGAQVKIEVTPVLRGSVFEPQMRAVLPGVEENFGFAETLVVSFADLYGGKIVAALDRQHPRDFFDVRGLLAGEGIDHRLRQAFLVYLLSHDRPMSEVLAPTRKDISEEYLRGFEGMTETPVSLDELVATREELIKIMVAQMPDGHRRFLVQFERGEPDWSLLDLPAVPNLPAVRWRQHNLDKLDAARRARLVARLEEVLGGGRSE